MPREPGLHLLKMMDAAAEGHFKALWAMGYDVLLTNPQLSSTRRSLKALELLVVQDIFMNETARAFAHVVLPSACVFEKDGTFMNAERRVQRVRKVLTPPGDARADWEALCDLRTKNRLLRPTDRLDMMPGDGARLDLEEGDRVRVTSRYGTTVLSLHLDERCSPGQVFATFSDATTWLNAVTGPHRDSKTGTPEYKLTAVRIEKANR